MNFERFKRLDKGKKAEYLTENMDRGALLEIFQSEIVQYDDIILNDMYLMYVKPYKRRKKKRR